MPKIEVLKAFKHADITEVHPREYAVGVHDVSDRCAEVALTEGWAKMVEASKEQARPTLSRTGAGEQFASSEPVKASPSIKPKRYGRRKSTQS